MRFFRAPAAMQLLLRSFEWRKSTAEKVIYLTFDDGPIPEVTDFVLTQLQEFNAKATFFCVGENLHRYPQIAQQILNAGHRIGNHTFNHIKGWETETEIYLENVSRCETEINKLAQNSTENAEKPGPAEIPDLLFRPPYGKISRAQMQTLRQNYRLIMWDVLTYDFDATFSPESCLKTSIALTRPGSIVVFHDSLKARRNMEFALPEFLRHFHQKGYRFETL